MYLHRKLVCAIVLSMCLPLQILRGDNVMEASNSVIVDREQEANTLVQIVRERDISFIDLNFTDLLGGLKTYTITAPMFENALKKGVFFDGSSVKGYSELAASDLRLVPDMATFKVLPWTQGGQLTACMMCDIYDADNKPYKNAPRTVLKQAMEEAYNKGLAFLVSPEVEFFILKKDENDHFSFVDNDDYCASPSDNKIQSIKLQMLKALEMLGLQPEKTHHEVAPSQHEITLRYCNALDMADGLILAKNIMQFIARINGYEICFMPKFVAAENGNGMHVNYSLYDITKQANAFYDKDGQFNLSSLAKSFIAGNLMHMQEMTAFFNPSVNSYKRLTPGYEAPVFVVWGSRNRSALIRIPITTEDDASSVRAELRSPDPLSNPYLVFAALLKSGMQGVHEGAKLQAPITENLFKLTRAEIAQRGVDYIPNNLEHALSKLDKSDFMRSALGDDLVNRYVDLKSKELDAAKLNVTELEYQHHLSA